MQGVHVFDPHVKTVIDLGHRLDEQSGPFMDTAAGDLVVSEFTMLRAGRAEVTYFEPMNWPLKTQQATVLLVQETGLKKVTIDEARSLIREPTPVVVTYRHDDRPKPHQLHELWREMGSPVPDSEAVSQTFSRILRPGTLVFVLSARENIVEP